MLAIAPKNMFRQKVLEAYYIVSEKPALNEQLEPDRLNLFRKGVTWLYYSVNILTPWICKIFSCKITILCTDEGIKSKTFLQNLF